MRAEIANIVATETRTEGVANLLRRRHGTNMSEASAAPASERFTVERFAEIMICLIYSGGVAAGGSIIGPGADTLTDAQDRNSSVTRNCCW